jgi:GNAT superfamily N-acetyltransferase
MKIIKADPSNSAILAPLFDEYRRFYGKRGNLDAARRFLEERLDKEESVIFYAEKDGEALGFAQLYPSFSSLSLKRAWILNDLFVKPAARRQSIGRKLLARAEDHARETNAKGLTLKTAADNSRAQALYQSAGWRQDFRYVNYDIDVFS